MKKQEDKCRRIEILCMKKPCDYRFACCLVTVRVTKLATYLLCATLCGNSLATYLLCGTDFEAMSCVGDGTRNGCRRRCRRSYVVQ